MKNTIKAFALAVLAAGLVSCTDKPEFSTGPFVSLYRTSATVAESVNGTVYNIPVKLYNSTAGTSVSYSISGTAVNGLDYTLADQSGVLNIPAGADSAAIAVRVTGQPGNFTGSRVLRLSLQSATGGVSLNNFKNFTLTISDKDLHVDWKYLEGTWKAQDYDGGTKYGDEYEVTITKVDDTTLELYNLWDGEETLTGTVKFDEGGTSATISFAARQVVMDASAYGYGNLILLGQREDGNWAYVPAVASVSADGFILGPWNVLITDGEYTNYLYGDSYTTEFTK